MPEAGGVFQRLARLWRGSLLVRTVVLTVVLSGVAVTIVGFAIGESVRTNLFESRRDQLVEEAGRAATRAQVEFSQAGQSVGDADLAAAQESAISAVYNTVSTAPLIGFLRLPGQEGPTLLESRQSPGFEEITLSSELQAAVADGGETPEVAWQSVALPQGDDQLIPGLVVGSRLAVPQAGLYALYIAYDLSDVQRTLDFVQLTLVFGSLGLVILIGVITFFIVRVVVGPVRSVAETSEQLAAGQLEERVPERGEDELATLAKSFNRMADSLQSQIDRLGELSRLQQRFVADVSHELRTPLTTIRLAGDVLYDQRGDFPPAIERAAELLHDQTGRFELLLADLLEMSRFDAGAVDLETEPTNLVRLAEDAVEQLRPLAAERGSELRIIAPGGYFEAEVDGRRIRRILLNLLGNAVDHGEGRPIEVVIDSNADAVAVAVRDFGVGMTEDETVRVFDRFWRADPSRQRRTGGTGLGLAIALEDTQLHDGWLEVWSEPGEGSCFRLTLPRHPGAGLSVSPVALPPAERGAES